MMYLIEMYKSCFGRGEESIDADREDVNPGLTPDEKKLFKLNKDIRSGAAPIDFGNSDQVNAKHDQLERVVSAAHLTC